MPHGFKNITPVIRSNELPFSRGVYKIHVLASNGGPEPINRVLGTDEEGVLYIGSTPERTLQERLTDFRKTVDPNYKTKSHVAGRRYNKIGNLKERYPIDSLAITYEIVDNPSEREDELKDEYQSKFGEVPPLNAY